MIYHPEIIRPMTAWYSKITNKWIRCLGGKKKANYK